MANTVKKDSESEKRKALEAAISQIQKKYGPGAIMRLGDTKAVGKVPVLSTGVLSVDIATGIGGIPRGRIIEIYGPEASGKTTLTLHIIAQTQKTGGITAFIDAEHALDTNYAENIGVKVDDLLVSQPDYGEQALEITENLLRSKAVDLIVIDSVAALTPKQEIEGTMGDTHIGLQARLMSQALRKLTSIVGQSKAALVFTNQLRYKISTFGFGGTPEITTGGNALKYYASMRIDIRRMETIKSGTDVIGHRVKIKIAKNRLAPPFKQVITEVRFGEGIPRELDLINLGIQYEFLRKSGSWIYYGEERLGQGIDNAYKYLKNNPNLADKIEYEIRKKFGIPVPRDLLSRLGILVEKDNRQPSRPADGKK